MAIDFSACDVFPIYFKPIAFLLEALLYGFLAVIAFMVLSGLGYLVVGCVVFHCFLSITGTLFLILVFHRSFHVLALYEALMV